MQDGQAPRKRQQHAAATPRSSRGVAGQQQTHGQSAPGDRKVRVVNAKEAALAAAARRQDCTYDVSPTDRHQSLRRSRRAVASTD